MQVTYRPAARVPPEWLDPSVAGQDPVAIPFLDEDEATLAVAAVEALLARAHVAPAQVRRVVVSSRTRSGFGPALADALGIHRERVEEGAALLYGQTQHPAPGEGPVLHVQSDAPRAGGGDARGAHATARLAGPGIAAGPGVELPSATWSPDRATYDRLVEAERAWPARVPMGAHIPKATWDRSLTARYRLAASLCEEGHLEYPARAHCSHCARPTATKPLPRPGTLETYTVIAKGAAPSEFEPLQDVLGEYAVGVADFGGARVAGLFTEAPLDALRIGTPIDPVFRRLYATEGEWRYGTKFRLAPPARGRKA